MSKFAHPPLHLKSNGRIGEADDYEWLYVGDLSERAGWTRVRDEDGEGVTTFGLRVSGVVASYVRSDMIGATNAKLVQRYVALARGLSCRSLLDHELSDVLGMDVSQTRDVTRIANAAETTREQLKEQFPNVAVAAHHHTNVNVSEALQLAEEGKGKHEARKWVTVLKKISGATTATAASWLLWVAAAPPDFVRAVRLMIDGSGVASIEQLQKLLKFSKIATKQLQHTSENDYSPIFELDVLINRGVGEVDWKSERENRINARVAKISPEKVRKIAREIFVTAVQQGYEYKQKTVADWWETRWLQVPNGSAHPMSEKLKETLGHGREVKPVTKKMLLSAQRNFTKDDILALQPRIEAWPSVKYEWGKQRAIYGTDVEGFIAADVAFPNCEMAVPSFISIGARASEKNVRNAVSQLAGEMMPFCFDYEDFNSQHSSEAMQAVIEAYHDVFSGEMTKDQSDLCLWTRDSLGQMYVHGNEALGVEPYKANDTLLSGWRLTTMVNSVLNYAYLREAEALDLTIGSLHSGDDVFCSVENVRQVDTFLRRTRAKDIRAQASKASTGSIAEFLRIDHRAERTSSQYLTRNCATIAHSRIEGVRADSMQSYMSSWKMRLKDARSRGAPDWYVGRLQEIASKNCEVIYEVDRDMINHFMEAHPLEGGCNDAATELTGVRVIQESLGEVAETSGEEGEMLCRYMDNGINDLVEMLVSKIGRNHRDKVYDKVREATMTGNVLVRRRVNTEKYLVTRNAESELHNYRGWRSYTKYGLGQVVRGLSLELVAVAHAVQTPIISKWLSSSEDPIRLAVVRM